MFNRCNMTCIPDLYLDDYASDFTMNVFVSGAHWFAHASRKSHFLMHQQKHISNIIFISMQKIDKR